MKIKKRKITDGGNFISSSNQLAWPMRGGARSLYFPAAWWGARHIAVGPR